MYGSVLLQNNNLICVHLKLSKVRRFKINNIKYCLFLILTGYTYVIKIIYVTRKNFLK